MKKRYCLGTVLLAVPVLTLAYFMVLDPPAGFWLKAVIANLIAISYGRSYIRTANQMKREASYGNENSCAD